MATGKRKQSRALDTTLELVGRWIRLRLPAQLQFRGSELRTRGSSTPSPRRLGLQPFSAAIGVLRAAEYIDFTFDSRAAAEAARAAFAVDGWANNKNPSVRDSKAQLSTLIYIQKGIRRHVTAARRGGDRGPFTQPTKGLLSCPEKIFTQGMKHG
ncbi:hypothetical protein [Microbulbifer donghaiensis]|uniref:hypothetical protein n=1 Tax=Microbulbifer donghaiensis TaxID=494016 RepID=UPI001160F0E9|nr:hypothetical protein [Microbulbifer donghaiensis]